MSKPNNPWDKIIDLLGNNGCNRQDHPKVAALICDCNGNKVISKIHEKDPSSRLELCKHAEEQVIKKLLELLKKGTFQKNNPQLKFYTSLEPCNKRAFFRVPCAHKIVTVLDLLNEIHIGSLDPDPDIFGRGVSYLLSDISLKDRGKIKFANCTERKKIQKNNKKYIQMCERKYKTYFDRFVEQFPISSGHEEENYLRIAHGLARWFNGNMVIMINIKLPTFENIFMFHAWWAEGFLENTSVTKIFLSIEKDDWEQSISCLKLKKNIEIKKAIINEFAKSKKVKILIDNSFNSVMTKLPPKMGLFCKNKKVVAVAIPFYIEVHKKLITQFTLCSVKQLAYKLGIKLENLNSKLSQLVNMVIKKESSFKLINQELINCSSN